MWQQFIQWLEHLRIPCSFQKYWGVCCPGCGFQSALIELLKGNIWKSIQIYPALIPILITILLFFMNLRINSKPISISLKSSFFLSIILILSNYIINLSSI
ncbi:DUF2752 domain-containing protein [Marinifilum breve]|uniref:DUF2752 domain-containing protein n=1 Tax=Marinifilum breve TaxID=2184082 RepID=A0A2V3ZZ87_9BACT|nr:DUF2752 domain-containing protein [Marinifilum breve]